MSATLGVVVLSVLAFVVVDGLVVVAAPPQPVTSNARTAALETPILNFCTAFIYFPPLNLKFFLSLLAYMTPSNKPFFQLRNDPIGNQSCNRKDHHSGKNTCRIKCPLRL